MLDTTETIETNIMETAELKFHRKICIAISQMKLPPIYVVKECVCEATGVTMKEFESKTRKRHIVLARQIAMTYYASNDLMLRHSLEKIGNEFGKKDHSTVVYALRVVSRLIETNNVQTVTFVNNFLKEITRRNEAYPTRMNPLPRIDKLGQREKVKRQLIEKIK